MPQNFQHNYIFKQQSKSIKTGAVLGGSFTLGWSFPKGKNRTRVCTCAGGRWPLGGSRQKVQGLPPFLRSNCQWHFCWGTSARTLPGSWEQGVVLHSVGPQSKPHYPSPRPSLPSAAGETPGKDSERPGKTVTSREGDRPGSTLRLQDTPRSLEILTTRTDGPHAACLAPGTTATAPRNAKPVEAPRVFLERIRSPPVRAHQLI